jgi:hypothetical protein
VPRVVEGLELKKYSVPLSGFLINLFLAAIWSVSVLLKDGLCICQYLNFLTASLTQVYMIYTVYRYIYLDMGIYRYICDRYI